MGQAIVMTSTQVPLLHSLSEAYNGEPLLQTSSHQDLEATQMKDHPVQSWMHPADHIQPPEPLWQTSVAVCACDSLSLYSHMSHSQTDSVRSCCISWTHGSLPLTAHTHSHATSLDTSPCCHTSLHEQVTLHTSQNLCN